MISTKPWREAPHLSITGVSTLSITRLTRLSITGLPSLSITGLPSLSITGLEPVTQCLSQTPSSPNAWLAGSSPAMES